MPGEYELEVHREKDVYKTEQNISGINDFTNPNPPKYNVYRNGLLNPELSEEYTTIKTEIYRLYQVQILKQLTAATLFVAGAVGLVVSVYGVGALVLEVMGSFGGGMTMLATTEGMVLSKAGEANGVLTLSNTYAITDSLAAMFAGKYMWEISDSNSELKHFYKSIKDAPEYPEGFTGRQNGTKKIKINNQDALEELRKVEPGEWKKVYKDGYDKNGNEISIHYFESKSGTVFNVKTYPEWSNIN